MFFPVFIPLPPHDPNEPPSTVMEIIGGVIFWILFFAIGFLALDTWDHYSEKWEKEERREKQQAKDLMRKEQKSAMKAARNQPTPPHE